MKGNDGFHSAEISMQELKTKTDKEQYPLLILREGTYNPSLIFYAEARKPRFFCNLSIGPSHAENNEIYMVGWIEE